MYHVRKMKGDNHSIVNLYSDMGVFLYSLPQIYIKSCNNPTSLLAKIKSDVKGRPVTL